MTAHAFEIRLSKHIIALRIESDGLFTFDGVLLVYRIFYERQIDFPRFSEHLATRILVADYRVEF